MTLARTPLKRHTPIARGKHPLGKRKGSRRVAHPLPTPTGEPVRAEDVRDPGVAFGPQSDLCRRTLCCVCFSLLWRKLHGARPIDWSQLPAVDDGGQRSEAHHEPPRSLRADTDDDDTLPLCLPHHSGGFVSRHAPQWSGRSPLGGIAFWRYFAIDWTEVRDEMRLRTAALRGAAP